MATTLTFDTEALDAAIKEFAECNAALDAFDQDGGNIAEQSDLFAWNDECRLVLAEILRDAYEAKGEG